MEKNKKEQELDITIDPKKDEEKIDFTQFYVPPHKKKSVEVTEKNLKVVLQDSVKMVMMCQTPHGMYPAAYAIAHPQINDRKPLRFFVTHEGDLVINPKIVRHTRHPVHSEEGCMTYPDGPMVTVPRWNKCEVEYQTLDGDNKITEVIKRNLSSKEAKVYQHEIDHLDGTYVYDYIKG